MPRPTPFRIGITAGNIPVRVDLDKLIDSRLLVTANSGAGKSWLLRLIAEQAGSKTQLIIIDPEGEFATLREKVDCVLVGEGGELPADPKTAAIIARKLIEFRISAIVDLYELRLPERKEYVRLFLDSILNVPRAFWHPVLIIIDESHLFAPEKSHGEAVSLSSVIALMSQGRKRGFGAILATQRFSKLSKDAAAEANNILVGRIVQDVDRHRARDILGIDKEGELALRNFAPGEFMGYGPALESAEGAGYLRFTTDKVETSHPSAGHRHEGAPPAASRSIKELVAQLGDIPASAQKEAETIAELSAENSRLKRELKARPVETRDIPGPVRVVEREVMVKFIPPSIVSKAGALQESVDQSIGAFRRELEEIVAEIAATREPLRTSTMIKLPPTPPAPRKNALNLPNGGYERAAVISNDYASGSLSTSERKVLTALAQHGPQTKHALAVLAGYGRNGGAFNGTLGSLKRKYLMSVEGDSYSITIEGREALGEFENLPTGAELQKYWEAKLNKAEREILKTLITLYPAAIYKGELGERTGYATSGGSFNGALGKLKRLKLIEGGSKLKASSVFFA